MTLNADIRDILQLETKPDPEFVTKESLINDSKKRSVKKKPDAIGKRPEGMARELWGLLWTDNKLHAKDPPPLLPSHSSHGYKQTKAKIGSSKVRPWKWMPFTNPARKDGAVFHHWRKVADEAKDYPFARFNKVVDIPVYSDLEYQQYMHDEGWTRHETDHLFDLCKRFDVRFAVVSDRWDRQCFKERSVEDLKERFHHVCNTLCRVRAPQGSEPKIIGFDAEHERRRKTQLIKLFNRTPEQREEEDFLINELRKIDIRRKERDKKAQDLQKLITAADGNSDNRKTEQKSTKKRFHHLHMKFRDGVAAAEHGGIKFPDFKQSGVSLRSQRMKLPATVGLKRSKAVEHVVEELGIELNPIPTEQSVQLYNELRQDIVLLYELKMALAACEFDQQMLKHRHDTLANDAMTIGSHLAQHSPHLAGSPTTGDTPVSPTAAVNSSIIPSSGYGDSVTGRDPSLLQTPPAINFNEVINIFEPDQVLPVQNDKDVTMPQRKRRVALDQVNLIRKVKKL